MTRATTMTLEEYFAAEELSDERHEYFAGVVKRMAWETNLHAIIGGNILGELHSALRGKPCNVYGASCRIKLTTEKGPCVFYPNVLVVRESNGPSELYQERPVAVFEVISPITRRNDVRDKWLAYRTIPSLRVYILVEQDFPQVTVHRRTENGFEIELYNFVTDVIPLPETDAELPLARIYEGVEFDEGDAAEG